MLKKALQHLQLFSLRYGVLAFALMCLFSFTTTPTHAFRGGVYEGATAARGTDQPADLFGQSGTFAKITNVLLFIVGAISVIMIIVGGLRYVLSGGDSANVTAAKNTILYAIVGIIVSLLAFAAVNFVINSFVEGGGSMSSGGGGGGATSF